MKGSNFMKLRTRVVYFYNRLLKYFINQNQEKIWIEFMIISMMI